MTIQGTPITAKKQQPLCQLNLQQVPSLGPPVFVAFCLWKDKISLYSPQSLVSEKSPSQSQTKSLGSLELEPLKPLSSMSFVML